MTSKVGKILGFVPKDLPYTLNFVPFSTSTVMSHVQKKISPKYPETSFWIAAIKNDSAVKDSEHDATGTVVDQCILSNRVDDCVWGGPMDELGSLGDRVVLVGLWDKIYQDEGVDDHTLGLRRVVVEGEHIYNLRER